MLKKKLSVGAVFEVPMFKKWHAAVARSTFSGQNAQNTTITDRFWKFRSAKIARRCGDKYICKSKRAKHHTLGHAAVTRSAFSTQNAKSPQSRTDFGSFDPQKLHAAVAIGAFVSQNAQNTTLGPLFEVPTFKNCTPLWRDIHL